MSDSKKTKPVPGQVMRRARMIKGGTDQLATFLGCSAEEVDAWCNDAADPPEVHLERALDLVARWIMSGKPN